MDCVSYPESSLTCKFELNTAILHLSSGQEKSDFPQLVPDTLNRAFCVIYAETSLGCKIELNTAILDFDQFEVTKNPIFHNSSRRSEMMRFVLVTLRAASPANLSSLRRF